jgi:hypothetical protein
MALQVGDATNVLLEWLNYIVVLGRVIYLTLCM